MVKAGVEMPPAEGATVRPGAKDDRSLTVKIRFASRLSSVMAVTAPDDARDFARYSDIALGSGIVLGVGSITLYFVEGRAISTERLSGPTDSDTDN